VRLGGAWNYGSFCGVRAANFFYSPLSLSSGISARGFAESAANRL